MNGESVKPNYSLYNLKSTTNVIINNTDDEYKFWICGTPDDEDEVMGIIFMFNDEMLIKLRKLIDEHIGN